LSILDFFLDAYRQAPLWQIILEAIAFVTGIASVWFAKKENILVYPVGLVATAITVYLLYVAGYYGDMIVNVYFTVMSVYGWYNWSRHRPAMPLRITRTNSFEKLTGFGLFCLTIVVIFQIYRWFGQEIKPENYVDIFTSGLFFTAMWYMARKKIENWTLWIIGDAIAVPLYAYRGLGMLALQYVVFTILAVMAYIEWRKILNKRRQTASSE
jgi:nicotinamide mononucleotide transporter